MNREDYVSLRKLYLVSMSTGRRFLLFATSLNDGSSPQPVIRFVCHSVRDHRLTSLLVSSGMEEIVAIFFNLSNLLISLIPLFAQIEGKNISRNKTAQHFLLIDFVSVMLVMNEM